MKNKPQPTSIAALEKICRNAPNADWIVYFHIFKTTAPRKFWKQEPSIIHAEFIRSLFKWKSSGVEFAAKNY